MWISTDRKLEPISAPDMRLAYEQEITMSIVLGETFDYEKARAVFERALAEMEEVERISKNGLAEGLREITQILAWPPLSQDREGQDGGS